MDVNLPLRLMAVHAHPDDESSKGGATSAKYVAEGVEVMVVTCTGGVRSGMAYLALRNANIVSIANYDAGMWGWTRSDNAVTNVP